MKILYYYHVPKTGGTTIFNFLNILSKEIPKSKLYNFNLKKDKPQNINFYSPSSWLSWNNVL